MSVIEPSKRRSSSNQNKARIWANQVRFLVSPKASEATHIGFFLSQLKESCHKQPIGKITLSGWFVDIPSSLHCHARRGPCSSKNFNWAFYAPTSSHQKWTKSFDFLYICGGFCIHPLTPVKPGFPSQEFLWTMRCRTPRNNARVRLQLAAGFSEMISWMDGSNSKSTMC